MKDYYKQQLTFVEAEDRKIKITSLGSTRNTEWLDLNDESANVLVEWLKSKFNIKSDNVGEWSSIDIMERCLEKYEFELDIEHARTIMETVEDRQDATVGINWDLIDECIEEFLKD